MMLSALHRTHKKKEERGKQINVEFKQKGKQQHSNTRRKKLSQMCAFSDIILLNTGQNIVLLSSLMLISFSCALTPLCVHTTFPIEILHRSKRTQREHFRSIFQALSRFLRHILKNGIQIRVDLLNHPIQWIK